MSADSESPQWRPTTVSVCGFGLVYIASAELGNFLSFSPAEYWPFWPPSGLVLGALLVSDRRSWPGLVTASLVGALISDFIIDGESLLAGVCSWFANTIGTVSAAWFLRRYVADRLSLVKGRHFAALFVIGAIFGPALGATLGTATAVVVDGHPYSDTWIRWWIGDGIGVLVVAPVVITWMGGYESPRIDRRSWAYTIELLSYCVALAIIAAWAFHRLPEENILAARYPFFMIMPLLLWAGIRFEPRGASLCVLLLGLIVTWCTTRGYGAIAWFDDSVTRQGLLLQILLAQASFLTLLFSTSIERRELAEARLRDESQALARTEVEMRRQRDLLQSILDSMGEAVMVTDAAGRFLLHNPAAEKMRRPDSPATSLRDSDTHWQVLLADGVTPCPPDDWPLRRALRGENSDGVQLMLMSRHGGEPIDARLTGRPIRAADGAITGAVIVCGDISEGRRAERAQAAMVDELQRALQEIKTLRGLIPICAQCKKIRNDEGAWERFEAYLSAHTEAEFTHGFCPDCSTKLYGELR